MLAGPLGRCRRLGAKPAHVFQALALERLRLRLGLLAAQRLVQQPLCRFLRFDAQPFGLEPMGIRFAAQPLLALLGFPAQVLRPFSASRRSASIFSRSRAASSSSATIQALRLGLRGERAAVRPRRRCCPG